jgi:hypothetical protein
MTKRYHGKSAFAIDFKESYIGMKGFLALRPVCG